MAKGKDTKKKNLKLRRQLRKTLGCLFMVSAIIVTTIPVQPVEAESILALGKWIVTTDANTNIPKVLPGEKIYQTGDSNFRFAYVGSTNDKYAVIVGYNKEQTLNGGNLTIPNEVDAYVKYSDTEGTSRGYAAAAKDGTPLFYASATHKETIYIDEEQSDGHGGTVIVKVEAGSKTVIDAWSPCYYETYSVWHNAVDNTDVQLYYQVIEDGKEKYVEIDPTRDRIRSAKVKYIGSQTAVYDTTDGYKIAADGSASTETDSVFGGKKLTASNIINLTIGPDLLGIGRYAFYNCNNIKSITFGNGLNTIEQYAFADCGSLNFVTMPIEANITMLGDHAFYNCGRLQSFDVPSTTQAIGDSCFENCNSMTKINLVPSDKMIASNLRAIGYDAFKNCTSLTELVLPEKFSGEWEGASNKNKFHLSTVKGCTSLTRIMTYSEELEFVSDTDIYTFADFKNEVGKKFYLEAPGYKSGTNNQTKTPTHIIANTEHIAFKYLGVDKYEIVEVEKDVSNVYTDIIYAINQYGELITFEVKDKKKVPSITMPEQIGPYGITAIQDGSFSDNCWIQKVTIPASVLDIRKGAFRGCHNLRDVIFTNAKNVQMIEDGAFATQTIRTTAPAHLAGDEGINNGFCGDNTFLNTSKTIPAPYLSFSGDIVNDSGVNTQPFKYAMKASNFINVTTQPDTYITYFSGWPTNLTVQYNFVSGQAELIGYPTKADLVASYEKGEVGAKEDMFPYLTADRKAAASGALAAYNGWDKVAGSSTQPTSEQLAIVNAVYNMIIPSGVTAIKTGLFSGRDANNNVLSEYTYKDASDNIIIIKNDEVKSITLMSIDKVESYAFSNLTSLETFNMNGGTAIGSYAFDNCDKLTSVSIGPSVMTMGIRPFKSCALLKNVSIPSSDYLSSNNAIIYGKTNGVNTKIIECLETRGDKSGSTTIGPDELSGITSIEKEAFMNCDGIGAVDLSKSTVKTIPERCFADYESDPDNPTQGTRDNRLGSVILPAGATNISAGAFWNSNVYSVRIPSTVSYIEPNAFSYTKGTVGESAQPWNDSTKQPLFDDSEHSQITFICLNESPAAIYAEKYTYINTEESSDLKARYTVYFFDAVDPLNPKPIEEQLVISGDDATLPTPPTHTGYTFSQWYPSDAYKAVSRDIEISALYTKSDATTYTVRFFNYNKELMNDYTQQVVEGKDAVPPAADKMVVEGKVFTGWDRSYSNITSAVDIYATYVDKIAGTYTVTFWADMEMTTMVGKPQQVASGDSAIEPAHPTKTGYTFSGWYPATAWQKVTKDLDVVAMFTSGSGTDDNGNNNGNNGNNNNGNNSGGNNSGGNNSGGSSSNNSVSGNSTKYTVTVSGGSGSGDYTPGTIVNINAYATADGQVFDKWTSSSAGVGFVNASAISTSFTMPANNVAITANQKAGKASSSSVSGNARNTLRNSTTGVDVTKSGISNTDLVSANVNGSSDNYVIRITEDAQATAAVIAALEAKYGDLSNIAYWPMDISLYDETGQTKITDISGVTVDITLPLPDELIQYAGNNKAASVVNSQLEELGAKFTTIDGVPCIQFTATHFSPYTIYVDKANLTEGLVDATPKTGDPIHPKWFLAIGLACVSVILFAKKDKIQPKVKTA
ncbi:List-Bact-rpt repeat protein [Kineothrix alysoides]|uniref:List-Bact-rpt repeat protein n=1 Tax=Kineothrix alysoides TaxID=1469948 RepID=A0A4R1R3G4_9FIRM|nr:leucine-rich repeat protein [Kineothrix alysoides]TCL59918.1 List-Bact-rpt repeat protein [Kineothrix alysoides]